MAGSHGWLDTDRHCAHTTILQAYDYYFYFTHIFLSVLAIHSCSRHTPSSYPYHDRASLTMIDQDPTIDVTFGNVKVEPCYENTMFPPTLLTWHGISHNKALLSRYQQLCIHL